jgi:hypothetical protein
MSASQRAARPQARYRACDDRQAQTPPNRPTLPCRQTKLYAACGRAVEAVGALRGTSDLQRTCNRARGTSALRRRVSANLIAKGPTREWLERAARSSTIRRSAAPNAGVMAYEHSIRVRRSILDAGVVTVPGGALPAGHCPTAQRCALGVTRSGLVRIPDGIAAEAIARGGHVGAVEARAV